MATIERLAQLETLWISIRPLQDRAKQRHDDQLSKDIEALFSSIAVICDGDPSINDEIKTARARLSLGHPQAALEKSRAILIDAARLLKD
ncbi:hypothetical protein [Burkholderia sp. PAMC 26561]|uniref:hypothetical protein n=1 Tax=Burkholderia sp. PAMC 26561 TaxID=1795043 RepID=UPI00076AFB48|nr:hypothetical protein [Burkholderia sp. PAMC 26561]AME22816.1 hypothetical protein AXG89_02230 [Burkholderia sp. PAMC 26561]